MKKTLIFAIAILSIAAVSALLYVNKERIEREMLIWENASALGDGGTLKGYCDKKSKDDCFAECPSCKKLIYAESEGKSYGVTGKCAECCKNQTGETEIQ